MVDGTRLKSGRTLRGTVGSNPTLIAWPAPINDRRAGQSALQLTPSTNCHGFAALAGCKLLRAFDNRVCSDSGISSLLWRRKPIERHQLVVTAPVLNARHTKNLTPHIRTGMIENNDLQSAGGARYFRPQRLEY